MAKLDKRPEQKQARANERIKTVKQKTKSLQTPLKK